MTTTSVWSLERVDFARQGVPLLAVRLGEAMFTVHASDLRVAGVGIHV